MRLIGHPIRGSLITVAMLAAGAVASSCAQPVFASRSTSLHEKKHDVKRQVEALEEQWRTAQLTGDIAAMDQLLSDDYIGISMTGQVNTKTQQLDRARNHSMVLTRLDFGDMQVKLVGGIAIVTSRAEVEGVNDGISVKGTFRYTRVYQHLPSGEWKITSFEATRVPQAGDTLRVNREKEANAGRLLPPQ